MATQLELTWNDAEGLRRALEEQTGLRLVMTVTDNSSRVLSFRPSGNGAPANLRLHHMFLAAPPEVVQALADWISRPKAKCSGKMVDAYVQANSHLMRARARRRTHVCVKGQHHDLQRLYDEVNERHFESKVNAPITWGRRSCTTGKRRTIRFGSYSPRQHLIRIHPALDQEFVPEFFVRYIIFHEMLHAALGVEESVGGRRQIHPPEFKRQEKAYPDYLRALAWQDDRKNLSRLLRS